MDVRTVAAAVLIAIPVVMIMVFVGLGRVFDYPKILRERAEAILTKYLEGGRRLKVLWYVFAMTAVAFVPIAVLLHLVLIKDGFPYLVLATSLGVLAGIVQAVGLLRWVFLVPYLAETYADSASSPAARDAAVVLFQGMHRFLGMGIGEHLGYLFTGLWTLFIAIAMTGSSSFHPWLAWFGVFPAVAILAGLLEPTGWKASEAINAFGYTILPLWLIATGFVLLF